MLRLDCAAVYVRARCVAPGAAETADQEMQIMLLASAVVVLLIAATVLLTGWFWMFVVKRRSRA